MRGERGAPAGLGSTRGTDCSPGKVFALIEVGVSREKGGVFAGALVRE